jgi:hypothetical protein
MIDQNVKQETVTKALEANENMLDQLGIYQHHDAVSGTARQPVADDYTKRLAQAMEQS